MNSQTKKIRVLLSAYSCEPDKGSEPAVGWGLATNLSKEHEVWVLTRSNNQPSIEKALSTNAFPDLHFVYFDLPGLFLWLKRMTRCVRIYYYLWQLASIPLVRSLHRKVGFQVCQHVTMVKYWAPSNLMALSIPFVWGPVGGGESIAKPLLRNLSFQSRLRECARHIGRKLGELDPLSRRTALKATLGLATTPQTAARMMRMKTGSVECLPQVALEKKDVIADPPTNSIFNSPLQFLCVGRFFGMKGFNLAIHAFRLLDDPQLKLILIGDGPEKKKLQKIALPDPRIEFTGFLKRNEVLSRINPGSVLVHPSMHESGGLVCLEAMAAGAPVICLDTGGPSGLVGNETGFKIQIHSNQQVIQDISRAMKLYATRRDILASHSRMARIHVLQHHLWKHRCLRIRDVYKRAMI